MTHEGWDSERRRLWDEFSSTWTRLADRLDDQLQQHHDLALIDYQILSALVTAPDRRLRMSELAAHVLVSRSRLTYRIDRLVGVGFVAREECEDDRRGMWAIIDEPGEAAYRRAKVAHEAAIDSLFFDQISDDERTTLSAILGRVAQKLAAPGRDA